MTDFSLKYTKIQVAIIALVGFIDIIWINFSNITFYYDKQDWFYIGLLLTFLTVVIYFYEKANPHPVVISLYKLCLILFAFNFVAEILCYLAYTTNFPLADSFLASLDESLGFHAPDYVNWFRDHPIMFKISYFIYNTFTYQFLIIFFYLGLRKDLYDLEQLVMLNIFALLLTILIGGFFPAASAPFWYNYAPEPVEARAIAHMFELRNLIVDTRVVDGIITFPSYHTTMAVVYAFVLRNQKKYVFIPVLILNILMIFTCIINGGHYLIDLIASPNKRR